MRQNYYSTCYIFCQYYKKEVMPMDNYIVQDVKEIKEAIKDLDDRITKLEINQAKFDTLCNQIVETQNELTASNKMLAETMSDVKFTMVEMKHSIENSNKEIVAMKVDISDIRNAFEEEKKCRTINIDEINKEETKKKLTAGQKVAIGVGSAVGGSVTIVGLIEIINKLVTFITGNS